MKSKELLEEKKKKATELMKSLPGPIDVMWMFLRGDELPEEDSKELWDHIKSLKEESQ